MRVAWHSGAQAECCRSYSDFFDFHCKVWTFRISESVELSLMSFARFLIET